jgi:hypothetical protein
MLETLAGRLKWQRTEQGIRVEYRMRGDYPAMWGFMKASWRNNWPGLILVAAVFYIAHLLDRHGHITRWWDIPLALLLGSMLGSLTSILANRTILTLDSAKLELESLRWNWRRGHEIYPTTRLHDLRFVKPARGADTRNGLRLNEIQFNEDLVTQYFATGITEAEASALIAKMMQVYPFPK